MWVVGGSDRAGNALAAVEVYSLKTNSWRSCPPLIEPRCDGIVGLFNGRVVVAGGRASTQGRAGSIRTAEIYTGNGWNPVSLASVMRAGAFRDTRTPRQLCQLTELALREVEKGQLRAGARRCCVREPGVLNGFLK